MVRAGLSSGEYIHLVVETLFAPDVCPRDVYVGDRLVGFLMYDVKKKGQGAGSLNLSHHIYRNYQGKGYGQVALSKALEDIRVSPWMERISIRYIPENPVAKTFYTSISFVEVGPDCDGKVIAVLKL